PEPASATARNQHIWDASIHLLRLLTDPARTASLPSSLQLLERIKSCTAEAEPEKRAFNIVELGAGTAVVTRQYCACTMDPAESAWYHRRCCEGDALRHRSRIGTASHAHQHGLE
ncbi:hypothetical protein A4X06_0g5998, partial [Tilletia controversa]